jgi:hypothetical protein
MKLVEFQEESFKPKLDFDVADDLLTFMRNDPQFYRKEYYPTMVALQKDVIEGNDVNFKEKLNPMIKKACGIYARRYDLPMLPEELLTDDDNERLVAMLSDDEQELLRKGDY